MSPRNPFRCLLAAAVAACVLTIARAEIKAGDPFPSLAAAHVANLAGGEVPAVSGKVTLVDFWASWCAPCKASFPAMAKLDQELGGKGFQVVAISVDEKAAAAAAFYKRLAPPFTALHDREQKLVELVGVPTMPTSYLLDRTGRVRFVHVGFHGNLDEVRHEAESLLAEK